MNGDETQSSGEIGGKFSGKNLINWAVLLFKSPKTCGVGGFPKCWNRGKRIFRNYDRIQPSDGSVDNIK